MVDKVELVTKLVEMLVKYVPALKNQAEAFSSDYYSQRALLRGLMNMHNVHNSLPDEYFVLQDQLLSEELKEKKIVTLDSFEKASINANMSLLKGDITLVKADAIVNSATSSLLGCFQAGHNCTDNCIHSAAGLQLRYECYKFIKGGTAKEGSATITHGFNLPAKYVIHAVAPAVGYNVTDKERGLLASCYSESLKVARKNNVKSVVFSCIGTDTLGFPNGKAAEIAVKTVREDLDANGNDLKVGFVVSQDRDYKAYKDQLIPPAKKKDSELHPFFNINLI